MNTNTISFTFTKLESARTLPVTPRGRALFTLDWFLNGSPVLRNHDNPQLSIFNGCHC